MPLHVPETIQKSPKPLILVYSSNTYIHRLFLSHFETKCSLLFLSEVAPPTTEKKDIYHVKPSDAHLLPHLEETIDYAVMLLSSDHEKATLEHVFAKISLDHTKSILAIPAEQYNGFSDVLLGLKHDTNIIPAFYGQILEDPSGNEFLKFIQNAITKKAAHLDGNDLLPVFPISGNDLLIAITYLLFSHPRERTLPLLFYKHPETLLATVHELARHDPDITMHANHDEPLARYEERKDLLTFIKTKLLLTPRYMDSHLKGFIYAIEHLNADETHTPHPTPHEKRTPRMRRVSVPRLSIPFSPSVSLTLVVSFILFIIVNVVFCILGVITLRSAIMAYEEKDFRSAHEKGVLAQHLLSVPTPTLSLAESALSHIPFFDSLNQTLHLVNTTTELTGVSSNILNQMDRLGKSMDSSTLTSLITDTHYLYHEGSRLLLSTDNRALSSMLTSSTTNLLSALPVLPTILGYEGEKEYLLLFQNNGELRPTGGFIGSIGRLVIENGAIKDFSIQDVYELDGQLKQHIEPHYIIRRNLQPHLYLRDSNFALDFQESASQAATIYHLESGNEPDGVVALNFTVLERLLEITGPIELAEYETTVTAETSFDFLQKTIDDNFFPGSTQKRAVLEELMTHLLLKFEDNPDLLIETGLLMPTLLEEKHIQLSYGEERIQSLFSSLGYGGVVPHTPTNKGTIYDTVGFNEANIGVNKVNTMVSRSIEYEADATTRRSVATLTLRNDSDQDAYKTYVRLIAPENSVFRQLLIDGTQQETIPAVTDPRVYETRNFNPDPSVYEVDTIERYDKTLFGTVVTIPKKSTRKIQFTYSNPELFVSSDKSEYHLSVIKQPGTLITPLTTTLLFDKAYAAEGESIHSYGDGSVKHATDLRTDLAFQVRLKKE